MVCYKRGKTERGFGVGEDRLTAVNIQLKQEVDENRP